MEGIPYLKCVCGHCGEVIEYLPNPANIVCCPKCKEQSELPDTAPNPARGEITPPRLLPCPVCRGAINVRTLKCDDCEARRKRRLKIKISIAVAALLLIGCVVYLETRQPPPPHNSMIILTRPEAHLPKSLSDLKPGQFTLERKQSTDPATVSGNIENVSEYVHKGVTAEVDLLDLYGAKVGTVSDVITVLPPHSTWRFTATANDPRALTVRFAGIKEDQ